MRGRLLVLVLFVGSAHAQTVEYLFDEAPSPTVLDSTGNYSATNLPGPDNTAPVYGPGYSGTGLVLDGDGDFLSIGDIPGSQRFTVMAWVRHLAPVAQTFVPAVATEVERKNNEVIEKIGEYWLNVRDETRRLRAGGRFVGSTSECTNDISGVLVNLDSVEPVPYGIWTHVAMSYTGAFLKVFVNGKFSAQVATPPAKCDSVWPAVIGAKYSPFTYGQYPNGIVTNNFHGTMDCFKIFDTALTTAQVAAESADCGATPPPPPSAALSGNVGGMQSLQSTKCVNLATGKTVQAVRNGLQWDCAALPLQPTERVKVTIVGVAQTATPIDVIGGVTGVESLASTKCVNLATGESVKAVRNGLNWDCSALVVKPGQRVRIVIVGA